MRCVTWCHVTQVIAGLKSDIEALESQSFELQQVRDELDVRRSQLETENQQLTVKRQHLTGTCISFHQHCQLLHSIADIIFCDADDDYYYF